MTEKCGKPKGIFEIASNKISFDGAKRPCGGQITFVKSLPMIYKDVH